MNASKPVRLAVAYRAPETLRAEPANPRQHPKSQIKRLARSIQTFGFLIPILTDAHGTVVAGHARLQAAQQLGLAEVPTLAVEHLSEAELRAFRIADNRLSEISRWDDQLLAQSLKELSQLDLSFSLDTVGFDMAEIDLRIEGLDAAAEPEDEAPPEPQAIAVSQVGDLWLLGPHRILCADSRQAASYDRLMAGQRAGVVFTDPPYNVPIAGHVGGKGAVQHREFAMATGEMNPMQFIEFLKGVFEHLARCSRAGSIHYICMDWRHIAEITAAGNAVYGELKNVCVWAKNVGGMGSLYRSRHELIFVFKHGNAPHINNVELGRHGRHRTNVWEYRSIASSRRSSDEGDLLKMHPTVKPVRLVADALLDTSNRGGIVLDAFLGSGSTLVAAQRVGRVCYGLELDPRYVDVAIRRWQADCGQDAVHAETGQTFSEREAAIQRTEAVEEAHHAA